MLVFTLTACGGESSGAGADPDKAIAIAKEIKASPDDAEAILKKHGMTEEQFEALMFEIASDPKRADAFAKEVGG